MQHMSAEVGNICSIVQAVPLWQLNREDDNVLKPTEFLFYMNCGNNLTQGNKKQSLCDMFHAIGLDPPVQKLEVELLALKRHERTIQSSCGRNLKFTPTCSQNKWVHYICKNWPSALLTCPIDCFIACPITGLLDGIFFPFPECKLQLRLFDLLRKHQSIYGMCYSFLQKSF